MQNKTAKGKPSKQASQKKPPIQKVKEVIETTGIEPVELKVEEAKPVEAKPEEAKPEEAKPIEVNGYQVPRGEEDFVHVRIKKMDGFDPVTGEPRSKPYIQKYGKREWKSIKEATSEIGYSVEVLHQPNF